LEVSAGCGVRSKTNNSIANTVCSEGEHSILNNGMACNAAFYQNSSTNHLFDLATPLGEHNQHPVRFPGESEETGALRPLPTSHPKENL